MRRSYGKRNERLRLKNENQHREWPYSFDATEYAFAKRRTKHNVLILSSTWQETPTTTTVPGASCFRRPQGVAYHCSTPLLRVSLIRPSTIRLSMFLRQASMQPSSNLKVLFFDVFGTCVNQTTSIADELSQAAKEVLESTDSSITEDIREKASKMVGVKQPFLAHTDHPLRPGSTSP